MDKRNGIYRGTYFSALDVFEDDDLFTTSHEGKQDIEKGNLLFSVIKGGRIEQKQLRRDYCCGSIEWHHKLNAALLINALVLGGIVLEKQKSNYSSSL